MEEMIKNPLSEEDTRIGIDKVNGYLVSTIFLGVGFEVYSLFETMVFGGKLDQEQKRYSTWEEAERGHVLMINRVKATIWFYDFWCHYKEIFHGIIKKFSPVLIKRVSRSNG